MRTKPIHQELQAAINSQTRRKQAGWCNFISHHTITDKNRPRYPLALNLPISKGPDRTRHSIRIRNGIKIGIFEGLRNKRSRMRVIAVGDNLSRINVDVIRACQVKLQRHTGGKIEIGVQCACTMTRSDRLRRGEFPDVVRTGASLVQAFLDTVAFRPNLREGQVDFSHDSCDVEPAGVADTASVLSV